MRQTSLVIGLLIIALLLPALPDLKPATAATPQSTGDWPQLQYDAQRSGATPQAVNGPYRFYWRWNEVPLASRIQPVVAAGRLFIGSINGTFYALDADADTGGNAPPKLWERNLGSPIRAGAAVVGDTVVVGTQAGDIYGLDVTNGNPRWRFPTGAAILAAPLVANDIVYIGSSSGVFFAINANTGTLNWNYPVNAPILSSAALSSDGTKVFFAAEDLAAYALSSSNGKLVWRTVLNGQSTADSWPVVSDSTVVFRTQPLRHFHDLLYIGDDVLDQGGSVRSTWAEDWNAVAPQIVAHLNNNPDQRTFFALNTDNGASRGIAPVLYTYGQNDPPAPPVVYNDTLYLFLRPRRGIQNDSPISVHIASKYDADLATMNPNSFAAGEVRASNAFDYQWRATSDEGAHLSVAGSLLLIENWERLGAINLTNGNQVGIAQVAHNYPECGSQCQSNNKLMPFFPAPNTPSGPRNAEGHSRSPAIAAAGRIFWRVIEGGLASIGPSSGQLAAMQAPAPQSQQSLSSNQSLADAVPLATSDTQPSNTFNSYVTTMPTRPISSPPADLVQRLEVEVRRIINANGHLKPLFIERGISSLGNWPPDTTNPPGPVKIVHGSYVTSGGFYWYDPGELIYSLSLAYPYLSPELQNQLATYLKQAIARYSPLEPLPFGDKNWLFQGVDRMGYTIPFPNAINVWPPPAPPIQTLYALWAYAQYTGDWQYLSSNWSQIKSLFDARKGSINSYAQIAGAIGYYRIAQRLNRTAEASEALTVANNAFSAGLNFATFRSQANQLYPDMELNSNTPLGVRGQVFFGLVPEVGRFLRDQLASQVNAEIAARTGSSGALLWYATRAGHQGVEPSTENGFHGPELAWSIFLARAYAQGADQTTLRSLLDRPWGLGDPWYLQKLVATIEASNSAPTPVPTISAVTVESVDFSTAVIRWTTDIPASGWVEFGPTSSYGQSSPLWIAPVESHRVTIGGLLPEHEYSYRVCSTGPGGTSCSTDRRLTTVAGYTVFQGLVRR